MTTVVRHCEHFKHVLWKISALKCVKLTRLSLYILMSCVVAWSQIISFFFYAKVLTITHNVVLLSLVALLSSFGTDHNLDCPAWVWLHLAVVEAAVTLAGTWYGNWNMCSSSPASSVSLRLCSGVFTVKHEASQSTGSCCSQHSVDHTLPRSPLR